MTNFKTTFESPINIDDGYINHFQGNYKSTAELFKHDNGGASIEWVVDDGRFVEHIGLQIDDDGKTISGYDGVFEVPKQIIEWLEQLGYNCKEIKNE